MEKKNCWKVSSGAWTPAESLPITDRAFRYGMSIFETIAVREGRPLLLEAHLKRFAQAMRDFGGVIPEIPDFDFSQIGTGVFRFYLTAGEGGFDAPFAGNAHALFENAEVAWNLEPLRVAMCAAPYLPRPGGWKTGNYWQNIDALLAARGMGCDEALLFNPAGMLVGAAMANVFLRIDGRWTTPALETGARDGVVREWVLQTMEASEEILDSDSLRCCSAAFLTNSRIGIRAVSELDGRPLEVACAEIQRRYFDEIFSR
jgi:branched-subunit amino acid aminotransferase/4-amino-4-deoxychorismate lyase